MIDTICQIRERSLVRSSLFEARAQRILSIAEEAIGKVEIKNESIDDAELGYLKCPDLEKVGVTGEGTSEAVDVCENEDDERSNSASKMLSLLLRSSTSFGSNNGLSFGDIVLSSAAHFPGVVCVCCVVG
ncbi:hypothetical protein M7I_4992 [Glarea lozoyensis 74030]|uniref:Uncharacterized protein n=1 Tax=Glarea lozoyensis (strain ATCC 74030 / MF5533) TaxID=1104152 RepID=H0EQN8_GLAL7|nr:hypothetical protein M7I_4992 [Glarea lozoyensis 74030]